MTRSLVWISGASSGIGRALAANVPWNDARVVTISRNQAEGLDHVEHLEADLADPASWPVVAAAFGEELDGFDGDNVAFFHAAGTIQPMGFAAEVGAEEYARTVLLNSAAPQVLGQAFVAAARDVEATRHLVFMTSGAATSVYPGWSAYGAGKAAIDTWVRDVGAEQAKRGGVHVMAIGPGTVDTGMQAQIRETSEEAFPNREKFVNLHQEGKLTDPDDVARQLWGLLDAGIDNGSVADLRELASSRGG